jgi:hypothetical protein
MLSTSKLMDEAILGTSRNLFVIGSRAKNQIPRFYGTPSLTELETPTCQDAYGNHKIFLLCTGPGSTSGSSKGKNWLNLSG